MSFVKLYSLLRRMLSLRAKSIRRVDMRVLTVSRVNWGFGSGGGLTRQRQDGVVVGGDGDGGLLVAAELFEVVGRLVVGVGEYEGLVELVKFVCGDTVEFCEFATVVKARRSTRTPAGLETFLNIVS